MTTILMRDEEMTGKSMGEFTLNVLSESLTVRELLRSRVYQQIIDHNVRQAGVLDEIVGFATPVLAVPLCPTGK